MFRIVSAPLEDLASRSAMADDRAGGYVTFEGWVRDHNEGKRVRMLEYEAFESMAVKEGERILAEAKARFDIIDAHCMHRTGTLQIGEMAVWVGVTAAHRKAAFEACEAIIDEIKHRLPIWKKETYVDGDSGWVNCQHCHAHPPETAPETISESAFYARQIRLPEIGTEGQQRLKDSRVLVVGAGGLGSVVAHYLAAAGVGTLGICDDDTVSVSNLHRQILYTGADVGQPKVEAALRRLEQVNTFIRFNPHAMRLDARNVETLLTSYNLIVDCSDNFDTRYCLNDAAIRQQKILVQASIYQHEGQLRIWTPTSPASCLRCLWPMPPRPEDTPVCGESGVLGATAGFFGALQAAETIKQLLAMPGRLSAREFLTLDLLSLACHRLKVPRNPECSACGAGSLETELSSRVNEHSSRAAEWLIHPANFPAEQWSRFTVLHLGEPSENTELPSALMAQIIPWDQFWEHPTVLDPKRQYLLVCPYGGRSLYAASKLRRQGATNVYALTGGVPVLEAFMKQQETVR